MEQEYTAAAIVNKIPGMENKTYLELGTGNRVSFDRVKAGTKVGVDINSGDSDIYAMTTDDFFQGPGATMLFDAVYIDACHDFPQVLHDFNHAAERLTRNGVILLHDMNPPDETYTQPQYCSDAYKLLAEFLQWRRSLTVLVLNDDFGMTAVLYARPLKVKRNWKRLTYRKFRELSLPLVDFDTMAARVVEYVNE